MIDFMKEWFLNSHNQILLLGIIIAFGTGLICGRWLRFTKGIKEETTASKGDTAFFRGFRYILSNDSDHAIEEFTKSVQVNSDTIETYMALGNLYRSRGDIERAVRIRQSIIMRPNISEKIRIRVIFDLGIDYSKAGVLNRALKTFLKVLEKDPSNVAAIQEMEKIYEELKDWKNAYASRLELTQHIQGDHQHILAHYLVESGKILQQDREYAKAINKYKKAISTHKGCVDAYLHLGDLYFENTDYKKAVSTWKKIANVAPYFTFLVYGRLEGAYLKMGNLKAIEVFFKECAKSNADAHTYLALARYLYNRNDTKDALDQLDKAIQCSPLFWEARAFKGKIVLNHDMHQNALSEYQEIIDHLDIPYLSFQCNQCGFETKNLKWKCPQCKAWDTIYLIEPPVSCTSASNQDKKGTIALPMKSQTEE